MPWRREVAVSAKTPAGEFACELVAQLGAPGEVTRGTLFLGRAEGRAVVRGRLSLNGAPVLGGVVCSGAASSDWIATDAQGRFLFPAVEPGEVVLYAASSPPDSQAGADWHELMTLQVAAGELVEQDLELELDAVSIAGRVTSSEGRPLAGIAVSASGLVSRHRAEAATDADGRYRLTVTDAADSYRVTVRRANDVHSRGPVEVGSEDADFVLPELGRLRLRVLDAESGESLPPVWDLWWRPPSGEPFRRARPTPPAPDAQGSLTFELLASTLDLHVAATRLGYVPQSGGPVRLEPGPTPLELELRLERGLSLDLCAADDMPDPPRDHVILLVEASSWDDVRHRKDENGTHWDGGPALPGASLFSRMLRLSEGGRRARLTGLAPGRYRFWVQPDDLAIEPPTVELDASGPREIELRWR